MTYEIGEPITIKPGDIEPYDTFRATRELMDRIVEAENRAIKEEIEANTVVINGRKYGMIKDKPGLLPTIFGMRAETRVDMPDDWDFFIQQRPPKVQTNYDRVISMTPEELAVWMNGIIKERNIEVTCDGWLDWLKQEVDNEG